MNAWIEIDGNRAQQREAGQKEVRLDLAPGSYRIAVKSIYEGVERTIGDRQITLGAH